MSKGNRSHPEQECRHRLLKNCFGVEFQKLIAGMCFDLLSRQLSANNRGSPPLS